MFIVGDSVQEQQNLLRKCYNELEGFSKFLTAMAALKYGNFALCICSIFFLTTLFVNTIKSLSILCFSVIVVSDWCSACNSIKIGMTYGDRALLKSYLCPDLKEGSEQVKYILM